MRIRVTSLERMRTLAEAVAGQLRAGDLLILTGNLGAGKTTFTQSLGRGLGVAGRITSPTFVIAREHPSTHGGPALVHVDAYRLGAAEELSDLDLDSELEDSVTVVEWGEGLAEQLSADYLDLTITHADSAAGAGADSAAAKDASADDADSADGGVGDAGAGDTEATGDFDLDDPADDDYLVDENRTVDIVGHGPGWERRLSDLVTVIRTAGFDVADGPGDVAGAPGDDGPAHRRDESTRGSGDADRGDDGS